MKERKRGNNPQEGQDVANDTLLVSFERGRKKGKRKRKR